MTQSNQAITVVIGGTSGIGAAVAKSLQQRPGVVHIASRNTGLDVTDEKAIEQYFDELGPIDNVVVTAGSFAPGGAVTDVDTAEAQAAFDAKFWGAIRIAKYASKHIRSGGSITLTSGFLSRRTIPGTYVKTAMNAAIEAVTKILAKELGPIRVNVVSPGLTQTEAYAGMAEETRNAMFENTAKNLPAGRVGTAENLAQGYLLAIDNPFMTGAVIDIDGGSLIN